MCRNQQHIVESQGFLHHAHRGSPSQSEHYTDLPVNGKLAAPLRKKALTRKSPLAKVLFRNTRRRFQNKDALP
jgi:hypothetical protein